MVKIKKKYIKPKIIVKNINKNLIVTTGTGTTCCSATCLPFYTRINTDKAAKLISNLKVGEKVISLNEENRVITAVVVKINKVKAPPFHKMIFIKFNNGLFIEASFWHPLANNLPIGYLEKGDVYFGRRVIEKKILIYHGDYTYDILLDNMTNIYFVNNIPLKSTLTKNYFLSILPKIKEYTTSSISGSNSNRLLSFSSLTPARAQQPIFSAEDKRYKF